MVTTASPWLTRTRLSTAAVNTTAMTNVVTEAAMRSVARPSRPAMRQAPAEHDASTFVSERPDHSRSHSPPTRRVRLVVRVVWVASSTWAASPPVTPELSAIDLMLSWPPMSITTANIVSSAGTKKRKSRRAMAAPRTDANESRSRS